MKSKIYIFCSECQYRGEPANERSYWKILFELILFLIFILPWIFYRLLRRPIYFCPRCGHRNVRILESGMVHSCPFCGAKAPGFKPNCPQCGRKLSAGEKYQKTRIEYHKQKKWGNRD